MPSKQDILDKIGSLVNKQLPNSIQASVMAEVTRAYDKGIISIESVINQNIIDTNPAVLEFLKNYSFDLVKNMNEELAGKLRTAVMRNITEGKSYTQIVQDIKKIFNTTIERAKAISRTETARAYGIGQLEAARISPIKLKKYILAVEDNRTSPLCKRLSRKYNRENAIPINQRFKDNVTGDSWLTNPFHVNCRSDVIYIPVRS